MSIDLNTLALGHSSDRVLRYSDDFLPALCIFRALSCINRAAREVTLERNWAADFSVPVQFVHKFSVTFIHLQSSAKKSFHEKIITTILEHNK